MSYSVVLSVTKKQEDCKTSGLPLSNRHPWGTDILRYQCLPPHYGSRFASSSSSLGYVNSLPITSPKRGSQFYVQLVVNNVRFLINSMNGLADFTGNRLNKGWVSLILLPLVGNVADHVITVSHSVKKDLDLAISLAFGASVQMALLVIPFLVLFAWMMDKPLTLLFDPLESIILLATSQSPRILHVSCRHFVLINSHSFNCSRCC